MLRRVRLKYPERLIWAYKNLYAIEKLISVYRNEPPDSKDLYQWITGTNCPLCVVNSEGWSKGDNDVLPHPEPACKFCPWVFFEDADNCVEEVSAQTMVQRIARLARWEKWLLKIIEECWEDECG